MSEYIPRPDPFDELTKGLESDPWFVERISELNGDLEYVDRGKISITDDICALRNAYNDHVKAALILDPNAGMTAEKYSYI